MTQSYYLADDPAGIQADPFLIQLANGSVLGLWTDSRLDGGVAGDYGLYARVVNTALTQGGAESRVPDLLAGDQSHGMATTFANGNFAITFRSDGPSARNGLDDPYDDAYVKFYRADGSEIGPARQLSPNMSKDNFNLGIVTLSNDQSVTLVARETSTAEFALIAYRHRADGTQIGSPKVLVSGIDVFVTSLFGVERLDASIAAGKNGQYAVSWQEKTNSGTGANNYAIHTQVFRADGSKIGAEQISAPVVRNDGIGLAQVNPELVGLSGGGYALTYSRDQPTGTTDSDVYLRLLDARGVAVTGQVLVNGDQRAGRQTALDVLDLGAGRILVTYVDDLGGGDDARILGRVFDGAGKALTKSFMMTDKPYEDLTGGNTIITAAGEVLTSFSAELISRQSEDAFIFRQAVTLPWVYGTAGDDVLEGTKVNDRIDGGAGKDVIRGGSGNDTLRGGGSDDRIAGGVGHDRLLGGDGHDRLAGGAGNDRIFGGNGRDTLIGDAGNDTLRGDAGADVFVFNAQSGRDTVLDFQDGVDRLQFSGISRGRIQEILEKGRQEGEDAVLRISANAVVRLADTDLSELTLRDFVL